MLSKKGGSGLTFSSDVLREFLDSSSKVVTLICGDLVQNKCCDSFSKNYSALNDTSALSDSNEYCFCQFTAQSATSCGSVK